MSRTVKILTTLVVLLGIITWLGIYSYRTLSNTSKKLESHIESIENSLGGTSWEAARKSLTAFQKDWSSAEKTWTVLLDHSEMDNIDAALSRIEKYIETKDKALTLGEAANLRQFIRHIPEKEFFNIKNIM